MFGFGVLFSRRPKREAAAFDAFAIDGSLRETERLTALTNAREAGTAVGGTAPGYGGAHASMQMQPGSEALGAGRDGVLSVRHLRKAYKMRRIIDDVSMVVRRGEAVGLLGPNGAGKTTLFYMISGLIRPDAGVIELDGHDVTRLPMYRRARLGIGYLPQEPSIFRGLTVEDNIRAVLEITQQDRGRRELELAALLEEFDIKALRKSPAVALSGGERRRCEIARALASRPSFILLDEPFAGIDPIAVADIQTLVHHLKKRGIGVLITDHNVRETLGLIDRAYIIHAGRVLTEGAPGDIIENADVRRFYLGDDFQL
jgi:lipopolysaccharide export system ATP-binding protein